MKPLFFILLLCLAPLACEAGTLASWYGKEHAGKIMTNGKPFDPTKLTCASWFWPIGQVLLVEASNHRQVTVTVTDRGPAHYLVRQGRTLDLSEAAFSHLEGLALGVVTVRIYPVNSRLDSRPASR